MRCDFFLQCFVLITPIDSAITSSPSAASSINISKRKARRRAERRAERKKLKAMDSSARRSYMVSKIIERTQKGLAKALGQRGHQVCNP